MSSRAVLRLGVCACVAVLLAIGDAPAQAQEKKLDPEVKKQLREQARKATRRFNLGHFDLALTYYEHIYKLSGDINVLYSIAQCHRELGNYRKAIHAYKRFAAGMESASDQLYKKYRNRIPVARKYIKELKNKAAHTSPPAPATKAETGQAEPVALVPPAPPAPPPPVITSGPDTQPEKAPLHKKWWFWTLVGAVVVGGTLGILAVTSPTRSGCKGVNNPCWGVR